MTGITGFHTISLIIIVCGIIGVWSIVWSDLSDKLKLPSFGRLLFAAALGSGVLAFSIKFFVYIALDYSTKNGAKKFHEKFISEQKYHVTKIAIIKSRSEPRGAHWETMAQIPALETKDTAIYNLGKSLFYEKGLSINNEVSCATCHDLNSHAGADGKSKAIGVFGQTGTRNSPSVLHSSSMATQFWDGRANSLEDQAKGPLTNPIEMGNQNLGEIVARINQMQNYVAAFEQAFDGKSATAENLLQAIANFEKSLISYDTPYDKFVLGNKSALSSQQIRGMDKFYNFGCKTCHDGPDFSRASLNSLYNGNDGKRNFPVFNSDFSRKYQLIEENSNGTLFRIPSLRYVAETAPYFHNGSVKDLKEAVKTMAVSQLGLRTEDTVPDCVINAIVKKCPKPKLMNDQDVDDIVEFLKSLSPK